MIVAEIYVLQARVVSEVFRNVSDLVSIQVEDCKVGEYTEIPGNLFDLIVRGVEPLKTQDLIPGA